MGESVAIGGSWFDFIHIQESRILPMSHRIDGLPFPGHRIGSEKSRILSQDITWILSPYHHPSMYGIHLHLVDFYGFHVGNLVLQISFQEV